MCAVIRRKKNVIYWKTGTGSPMTASYYESKAIEAKVTEIHFSPCCQVLLKDIIHQRIKNLTLERNLTGSLSDYVILSR